MNQALKDLIKQLETRVRQLILQQAKLQEEQEGLRMQLNEKDDEIRQLKIPKTCVAVSERWCAILTGASLCLK